MRSLAFCSLTIAFGFLSACGTQPVKDFKGAWHPVNRFDAHPSKIPLQTGYTYYAAPVDDTLKTLLTRWAEDTKRTLDYLLDYDVTLYQPVSAIHTTDVQVAASQLNQIFVAQGVRIEAGPHKILVKPMRAAVPIASAQQSSAQSQNASDPMAAKNAKAVGVEARGSAR